MPWDYLTTNDAVINDECQSVQIMYYRHISQSVLHKCTFILTYTHTDIYYVSIEIWTLFALFY